MPIGVWNEMQELREQQMRAMMGTALAGPGEYNVIPYRTGLERLRNIGNLIAKNNVSVEELLELSVYGRQMAAEYERHEIPAPKWLPASLRQLSAAIKAAHRTAQEQRLAAAERELEELRSKEEKRVAKAEEVERLKKELGL